MLFDCLTDIVSINHRIFDGFGHGLVIDLMHWLLNWGVICMHRDSKYFLPLFKDTLHIYRE